MKTIPVHSNRITKIALGLGSNLAPRRIFLEQALKLLNTQVFISEPQISTVFENKALLPAGAPPEWGSNYLNLAVCGNTLLTSQELLRTIKIIEQTLGRKTGERWSPREIDIDILCYGEDQINTSELTIPHSQITKRPFVVLPLAEIWPDLQIAPSAAKTITDLALTMRLDPSLIRSGPLENFE